MKKQHKEPNAQLVRAFARYMLDYYGLEVVQKSDSRFMRLLAWFLNLIGVMDKKQFLEKASTVIGNKLYLPFVIGEDPDNWAFSKQISIIAHECQHRVQRIEDGKAFNYRYLFSSSRRAAYEADAYRVNLELYFWYTGRLLNISAIAEAIKENYGCTSNDSAMAKKMLERSSRLVLEGLIVSKAAKVAMAWIRENADDYKRRGHRNIVPLRFIRKEQ